MGLEELKVWKTFLWEWKQHLLKRRNVVADHVEVLGARYAKNLVTTKTFRSFSTLIEYCIKPDYLNCRSSSVVYLFFMQRMFKTTHT